MVIEERGLLLLLVFYDFVASLPFCCTCVAVVVYVLFVGFVGVLICGRSWFWLGTYVACLRVLWTPRAWALLLFNYWFGYAFLLGALCDVVFFGCLCFGYVLRRFALRLVIG